MAFEIKKIKKLCNNFSGGLKKNSKRKISRMIQELYDEIWEPDIFTYLDVGCDNLSCIVMNSKNKINIYYTI